MGVIIFLSFSWFSKFGFVKELACITSELSVCVLEQRDNVSKIHRGWEAVSLCARIAEDALLVQLLGVIHDLIGGHSKLLSSELLQGNRCEGIGLELALNVLLLTCHDCRHSLFSERLENVG